MTEAYRDNERAKVEEQLVVELVRCVVEPKRSIEILIGFAETADAVRGGMVGRTTYAALITGRLERLLQKDETEWIRLLDRLRLDPIYVQDCDSNDAPLRNLYDDAKVHSPFASAILLFACPNESPELRKLAIEALRSKGYGLSADAFAFELSFDQDTGMRMRPIWIRPIAHRPGERTRTGPYIFNT